MAAMLEGMVDKVVQIVTNDGRNIVGRLKGFDQTTNVILDECLERVFSSAAGVDQVQLGLYIVRGDNMCVLSPFCTTLSFQPCTSPLHTIPRRLIPHSRCAHAGFAARAPVRWWARLTRMRTAIWTGRPSSLSRSSLWCTNVHRWLLRLRERDCGTDVQTPSRHCEAAYVLSRSHV